MRNTRNSLYELMSYTIYIATLVKAIYYGMSKSSLVFRYCNLAIFVDLSSGRHLCMAYLASIVLESRVTDFRCLALA